MEKKGKNGKKNNGKKSRVVLQVVVFRVGVSKRV